MSQRSLNEPHWSCLRRYVGQRLNLFRAMHTPGVFLDEARVVLALRDGEWALTARVAYDVVFEYYYVRDCHWYRSDLSRVTDDHVPDSAQQNLLQRFLHLIE